MAERDNNKDKYTYSAFISYRHIDPDKAVAARIQHSIETFRIPIEYQSSIREKHFKKVFRDSDELSMDKDLAEGIDYALEQSEFLIVVLSPQYKQSEWCLHEIEEFLRTHDRRNILCVLADGEPRDVLPDIITHIPSKKDPDKIVVKEPLCADYRLDSITAEQFELPRILSSLLHCSYDDLVKRQEVYRRKRIVKIASAVIAAAAIFILLQTRNIIKLNAAYRDTLYSQSQTLAAQALQHLSDFDRKEALEYSIRALTNGEETAATATAEALHATAKATYAYRPSALAQIRRRSMQNNIVNYAITPENGRIITMDSSAWIMVQSSSGEQISYWQVDGTDTSNYGFTPANEYTVLAWRGGNIYSYDYEKYKRNWGVNIASEYNESILSAEMVGNTACSVMTQNSLTLISLDDGHVLSRLSAQNIEEHIRTGSESDIGDGSATAEAFAFQRQYVNADGKLILSGKIETAETAPYFVNKLCMVSWDPQTGGLLARIYDQPAFCIQMQSPTPGSLIAVSAYERFHITMANQLSSYAGFNEFSPMKILAIDTGTLDLKWEYDTGAMQTVNVPKIKYLPPESGADSSLVAITFDVNTYMFDLGSGGLFSAITLPDDIVLVDKIARNESMLYCSNHKGYSIIPELRTITETEGLSPFPENVLAAERIGDQIIAFSDQYIYWFGTIRDANYIGNFILDVSQYNLEFGDAGNNLLAAHTHNALLIIDLAEHKIIRELPLNEGEDFDNYIEWRFIGSLPEDNGILMLAKYEVTGKTLLYSYRPDTDELRELFTFSQEANFDPDDDWIGTFAYSDGTVYMISAEKDNTVVFYNALTAESRELPVQGLPDSVRLAESYTDHAKVSAQAQPLITLSPDKRYLFSSSHDSSNGDISGAVIDLSDGNSVILDTLHYNDTRTRVAAFSDDSSAFATSTNYTILIYTDNFSEHKEIHIDGLNVRSMYWYRGELWVGFSNNTVRRYSRSGEQISEVGLDHESSATYRESPVWTPVKYSEGEEALMLVDKGNMNLLSADHESATPILHIPHFIDWNNNGDSYLILDPGMKEVSAESGNVYLSIYNYNRYTNDELVQIGQKQLREMLSETEQ